MPELENRIWMNMLLAGATAAAITTVIVVWNSTQKTPLMKTRNRAIELLYEFQHAAATPLHALRHIAEHMAIEMHAGLRRGGKSNLLMLPTYVEKLPDGDEEGLFYALDLGGTNFRVLRCLLGGKDGRVLKQEYEEVSIPKALMVGTSAWSKGFNIAEGVGADVVTLLQNAINRQGGPRIEVAVLVNDTVGTLAGGRYWNEDVMVGMILGTGTNACYVERDLPGHVQSISGEMIINMEWGGFWSSHLPRTFADEQLDNESLNPGQAGYEKMIGGMYLGEIVRRVLLRMKKEASLFGGPVPAKLKDPFSLITPEVAKMHADESKNLRVVAGVLRDVFGIQKTELAARRIVHDVCDIVIMRSARLAAAGIVGILKKNWGEAFDSTDSRTIGSPHWDTQTPQELDTKRIVVAVDGGLYEHCTQYRVYMRAAVNELLSEAGAKRLQIVLSKDGSGVGACILAARHSRHRGADKITHTLERPPEAAEKSVHFCGNGSSRPSPHAPLSINPSCSQHTQSESPSRSTQFTQSELQSSWLQAEKHSVSYVYGLEYVD